MRANEHLKRGPILASQKSKQGLRVFADVMVHINKHVGTRLEFGQCARCDGDKITDPACLEQHLAVGAALEHCAT